MIKRKYVDDFEDNLHKRCKYENCDQRARYGYKDESATHCRDHKLHRHVDIKHKHEMCITENCYKRAYFGPKNQPPVYCSTHRLDTDIYRSAPMCCEEGCYSLAIYGNVLISKIPQHCEEHIKEGETDLGVCRRLRGKTKEQIHLYFFPKKGRKLEDTLLIDALLSLRNVRSE